MATTASSIKASDEVLIATFQLGGNDGIFGLDTTSIQEVVMVGELTPVRRAIDYVAGIRNLRGRIITVIDLCIRLDLGLVDIGPDTRILIADWKGEPIGLLVDRVSDAVSVNLEDVDPPPPNLHGVQMEKLQGVFRSGERLVALLDLEAVLGSDDRGSAPTSSEEARGQM